MAVVVDMKVVGGYVSPAPHKVESVPRTCWTCLHHLLVMSGMTTCDRIDNPMHTKMGIEPCEDYTLNAIWLEVDWCYPNPRGKGARE